MKQYTATNALLHFWPSMNFAALHKMYQMTASVIKSSAVKAKFTEVNKLVPYFPHLSELGGTAQDTEHSARFKKMDTRTAVPSLRSQTK